MIDYGAGHLTVRAIKRQIDGALGSRGAWLLEPYSDKPESTGLNTTSVDSIRETARLAIANGYQLCVHAIGDRANRETLNIFEEAFKANPDKKDLRWRIEHAQHLNAADIPRFGQLGVIASMQGVHCTSDAPYVPARLGDRRAEEGAYVWQKLMKSGAVVSNGTDAPVEDVESDRRLLRDGQPEVEGRQSVLRRPANEPCRSAEVLYVERRVCGVRGELTRLAEARQVRGRRRALEGHPEDPRGRDSVGPGGLHDRWREDPISATVVMARRFQL